MKQDPQENARALYQIAAAQWGYFTAARQTFRLVHDLDDTRQAKYGVYYSQKKPLALAALEGLPGI